jgi:hypothetical protein
MNMTFFYLFWLIPPLAAAGTIFWVNHIYRTKPGSLLVGLLQHRDHIWFAVLLLLIPSIVDQFIFLRLFRPSYRELLYLVSVTESLFLGVVYGAAACWFASPGKRPERFNAWMALAVAIALMVAHGVVWQMWLRAFMGPGQNPVPLVCFECLLVLCYVIWHGIRKKEVAEAPPVPADEGKKEYNPSHAFLWVLVGLAPIPLLLMLVSTNRPDPTLVSALLIISPICCLCGGIGCLGGIKSIPVRIILGLFLAVFFFGLAAMVALFQACSHGGGI